MFNVPIENGKELIKTENINVYIDNEKLILNPNAFLNMSYKDKNII